MALFRLVAILATLGALYVSSAAWAVDRSEPKQWSFGVRTPMTGTRYELKNLVNNRPLRYGRRSSNPQLEWGAGAHWIIWFPNDTPTTRDHRRVAVVSGQTYWLSYNTGVRGDGGGYFAVGTTSSGWNPGRGSPVRYRLEVDAATGNVAIFSLSAGDYLVNHAQRIVATRAALIHNASVWLTAQPQVQGFVPFLGRFGGGVNFSAVLTEVRNPAQGRQLWFVRPGFSSQQCGNPQAVIALAPGAALTPAQMTTLYNSSTPSLRNAIPFLVCAATQGATVVLNITYRDV